MKAQELRIGNYVEHEDPSEIVEGIHYNDKGDYRILIGNHLRPMEDIKPIPLTEEWLLFFGFENISKHSFWNYRLYNGWGISMWMGDTHVAGFEEKGVCYWGENYVAVKYVHQLQNLYFAVTSKEL